ncbi:hypothetical protein NDU88_006157 [Pleurodeles waltl]|uniref:Uncharacterized protein n=1 Tax=Pleurodeles waltl TaxID=8319 RepID=A0AAV7L4K3_PLEWA|nr:hypothetical protein NDU88_006157 [Pleurodeles waltl]
MRRRAPTSSPEGPTGPAQVCYRPPGDIGRPLVFTAPFVCQGVSSPLQGASTTVGARRRGAPARGPCPSRARHSAPCDSAVLRLRPAGPTHAFAARLRCGPPQEDRSRPR